MAGVQGRLAAAEWLALEMLAEHGLDRRGWVFGWNERVTALGVCRFSVRRIELSRPLILANDDAQMFDTVAHEVAHALAGPAAGHGPVWREQAVRLGARPERVAHDSVGVSDVKWVGTCEHGCEIKRHRLASSLRAGARCNRHDALVSWEDVSKGGV